jgi:uncharacterized protein
MAHIPERAGALGPSERIVVLDVLRGLALVGMFLVHFNDKSVAAASGLAATYQQAVVLFFDERFWTMFGILFGVGFAVQLRRAEARGGPFVAMYLRRVLALAGFGCIAHGVFGFNVLLGYAAWALPLLVVRRWPLRALVLLLVLSAASGWIYVIEQAAWRVATLGEQAYRTERSATLAAARAFRAENDKQQSSTKYAEVFRARLRHMRWFYAQPFSFLPVNTLTLFLLGIIGLRLGLFDDPARHRGTIAALMAFGAASWAAEQWLMVAPSLDPPLVWHLCLGAMRDGLGLFRGMWLAFVYMGAVLLLAARSPEALRWLGPFAWTGRMALTMYMIQIAILDLAFSEYAFNLHPTPLEGLAAGLTLFGAMAVSARWWLARFRFGPLEWLWRSATYARWQPWRAAAESRTVAV